MAVLGARILEESKRVAESAESQKIRKASESSLLMSISKSTESAINKALVFFNEWFNLGSKETIVTLNDDFDEIKLDFQTIGKLLDAVNDGKMSHDTFLYNMKRGEFLREGKTVEDEIDQIESENLSSMPDQPQGGELTN